MMHRGFTVDIGRLRQLSMRQRQKRSNKLSRDRHIQAQDEIDRLSLLLSIPEKARKSCFEIYRDACESGLIHGRSTERILAATIYMACRKYKVPRTLDEIEEITNVKRTDIIKTSKILTKRLGLKFAPSSPLVYLSVFCNKLNLKSSVEERARKIVDAALERAITSGWSPTGIAAAAIYMAIILCNEKRTQKEVAMATGITAVTLRARCKELVRELRIKIR